MGFLINTPTLERKAFAKHFLTGVHSEIRYKPIELEKLLEKKTELDVAFKHHGFSEMRDIIRGEFKLETRVDQPAHVSQEAKPVGIIFSNQSPRYEVKIEIDKIVYSSFSYISFEDYQSKFKDIFRVVSEVLSFDDNFTINKVGFRKINSVVIQPFSSFQNNLSIFNPALFGTARSGLLKFDKFKINEDTTVLEETDDKLFILRTKLMKTAEDSIEATIDADFVKLGKKISVNDVDRKSVV